VAQSPTEAREANVQWENAVQQYHAQLTDRIQASTEQSSEVRRLIRLGSLHDAEVLQIGTTEGRRLVVVLREENRAGTLLLTYSLVDNPAILRGVLPPEHQSLPRMWLYDELDREDETLEVTHAGRSSQFPVFRHSILMSDGIELQLRFYRIEVLEISPLLGSEQPTRPGEDILSNTA
jgi:hypothetical protein